MTETVLKISYDEYKKRTYIHTAVCCLVIAVIVAVGLAMYFMVSQSTRVAFIVTNVLIDTFGVWFVFFFCMTVISPRRRLIRLYAKCERNCVELKGSVIGVEGEQRVFGFDCVTLNLDDNGTLRKVFIVADSFEKSLNTGMSIRLSTADNIAVKCEVCNE